MEMSRNEIIEKAIASVRGILSGVASSDFVSDFGGKPVEGLREYGGDMVADVFETFTGEKLNDSEMQYVAGMMGTVK